MKIKNNIILLLASATLVSGLFSFVEPRITGAATDTDDVIVNQAVTSEISLSSPSDITMTALSTSQNTAVGAATWTVTTNNDDGYTLTLHASSAPALSRSGGGGNIADYTPAVSETPETWSVPASNVEFGFSAFGTDVNTSTYGTDSDCLAGADVPSAGLKWRDFDLTGSADQIATAALPTTTSGTAATMCVATEQDTTFAVAGSYSATITATATTL